ncbi:hypothetical protein QEN19_003122 [Hanseniaspora menglaensis]
MEDWRKIDIDALDASTRNKRLTSETILANFINKGIIHKYSSQELSNLIGEISARINKNDYSSSILEIVVKYPVYAAEDSSLKLHYVQLINNCLVNTKDIDPVLKQLSDDEIDVLLKYCYKIMSLTELQATGQYIVNWVYKIISLHGQGVVLRYITDRKTI